MTSHNMQALEPVALPTWRGRPLPLTRKAIEAEIDRLIDFLDVADGDADQEDDGGTEPSLGWSEGQAGRGPGAPTPQPWRTLAECCQTDDREQEPEHDEDGRDDEPGLGWTEDIDQERRLIPVPDFLNLDEGEEDGGDMPEGEDEREADDLDNAGGEFAGSCCHDDETDAEIAQLAEIAALYHKATPEQQAAALTLAHQFAADAEGREA